MTVLHQVTVATRLFHAARPDRAQAHGPRASSFRRLAGARLGFALDSGPTTPVATTSVIGPAGGNTVSPGAVATVIRSNQNRRIRTTSPARPASAATALSPPISTCMAGAISFLRSDRPAEVADRLLGLDQGGVEAHEPLGHGVLELQV